MSASASFLSAHTILGGVLIGGQGSRRAQAKLGPRSPVSVFRQVSRAVQRSREANGATHIRLFATLVPTPSLLVRSIDGEVVPVVTRIVLFHGD
jgi:hypothetical protein